MDEKNSAEASGALYTVTPATGEQTAWKFIEATLRQRVAQIFVLPADATIEILTPSST